MNKQNYYLEKLRGLLLTGANAAIRSTQITALEVSVFRTLTEQHKCTNCLINNKHEVNLVKESGPSELRSDGILGMSSDRIS